MHSEFWVSELASLVQVCLRLAVRGDGDVDFLFCARTNWLLYLLLNMYRKKPASSVVVDSAYKLKHVSLSIQRTKSWDWDRNRTVEVTIFTVVLVFSAVFA
jgi:hypothetical protein